MTDTTITETPADITLPDDDGRSRIRRTPQAEPLPDDAVTADERIAAFWRKHKNGRLDTQLILINGEPAHEVGSFDGTTVMEVGGRREFTVRATVWRDASDPFPSATAEATRSNDDPDPITAERPQETARTAALSAAIRFLGIKPSKR